MKRSSVSKFFLASAICGALLALPSAASAGSIGGTVTDSVGHAGIQGIEVCPRPNPYTFEVPCTETGAGGGYLLSGLPASSYYLHFSGDRNNLPYINEFFDNKQSFPGDLVTIGETETRSGVDAELAPGGAIAGKVTDPSGLNPVSGFPVCAFATTPTGEVGRCARTDSGGNYEIRGLPTEDYEVTFEGEGEFNYLTQYWKDSETYGVRELVPVTAPTQISGIDASLHVGAEISGTLTEVGTHMPLPKVTISLLEPGTEEVLRYVETDSAGHYAFRGRPAGSYVVAFSRTLFGPFNGDCYSAQYYKGAISFAAATPLTVSPPNVRTDIDGEVVNECPQPRSEPIQVSFFPTPQLKPPLRCKKGFHKKWIKGRQHCVKVHKKHHRHKRGRGPHAIATGH